MKELGRLPAKAKISTDSIGYKQGPESHKIIFKMLRIGSSITWHSKTQENVNSHEKRQWTDSNDKMTQT